MVDQEARRKYAELTRQFISGRMTTDEYESRFDTIEYDKNDQVIREVYRQVWFLYDDLRPHRMTKSHRLNRKGRHIIARFVLFLQSDQEYSWPKKLWDGSVFLVTAFLVVLLFALFPETPIILRGSIATLLVTAWLNYERWRIKRWEKSGDFEAWPFLQYADLEEARRHPRLLNGGRR